MIRMIKGTYGLVKSGTVEPMTKHSPAFSINATREAELVEAGVDPSMIRFSVGLESADDIIEDIRQALED